MYQGVSYLRGVLSGGLPRRRPATGKSHMKYDDCWYCLACEVDCPTNAITVKIPFLIR